MFVEDANDQVLVTIKGLMRGTLYTVKAESLTVAGPSYSNVSADIVTLPFRLDGHALGWLIFAAVIVGILALVGFTCCIRLACRKEPNLQGMELINSIPFLDIFFTFASFLFSHLLRITNFP